MTALLRLRPGSFDEVEQIGVGCIVCYIASLATRWMVDSFNPGGLFTWFESDADSSWASGQYDALP